MWIDFSNDKQSAEKTPLSKPCNEPDNVSQPSSIDDPNNTYTIQKESSAHYSTENGTANQESLDVLNTVDELDIGIPKSEGTLENDIDNKKYTETLSSNTRRMSSSTFIETLRKLVCLADRY